MSFTIASPDLMRTAAEEFAGVSSAIGAATDAARAKTTGLLPAAADEVSTRIAALFSGYADEYGALSTRAAAFHSAFVQALEAGAASYASAESGNVALAQQAATAFIMGGTFNPQPTPAYVTAINNLFIQSNPSYAGYTPFGLYTPESAGLIPLVSGFSLNQSILQGQLILNNVVMNLPTGSKTLIFGLSQSAVIATVEMRALDALPPDLRPSPNDLSFMLIGNGDTPNGGFFSRFSFNIPLLDISTYGATPPDTPYPTTIYTQEYDGFANFPQYPLNAVADLNALAGAVFVHSGYPFLSPEQLGGAVQLATSPGYYADGGVTHYYMIANQDLPLLAPVRAIPFVGTPLADLLQPDLRVLVNLGYNPNGYANIPTSAQIIPGFNPVDDLLNSIPPPMNEFVWQPNYAPSPPPNWNPATIAGQLVLGAQQGVTDALVDVGLLPSSYYATAYPAINDISYMTAVA
jgi:PE-PPE domain/PE family